MLIEAPELAAVPGLRHAFFTREDGVSDGLYRSLNGGLGSADDPERVRENRGRMAARLGIPPANLVSLYQVHSAEAVIVTKPWSAESRPKADGMATARPGIALAIATADCGPVLFADRRAGVIGAAHAGWKGALGGVLEATLARMEALGAHRADVVAVLGPTIGPASYEVGPDLVARFVAEDHGNGRWFRAGTGDRSFFDLPGYIVDRLERAGLACVRSLDLCTYADERRFFSYRRATHRAEPDYGRLISALALER